VPVKDFELHDLGGERGATRAQLAETLLKLVEPSVGSALKHADLAKPAHSAVGKAVDKLKGLFH
jgi:hypothetical protein